MVAAGRGLREPTILAKRRITLRATYSAVHASTSSALSSS